MIDEVAPDHPVATDVQDSPPVITGSTHSTGTAGSARAENGISEEPLPTRETYVYVDELPVALFRATPIYPAFAQDAGFDGKVVVHMLVGKDGHVLRAEVDEKLHAPLLDAAALEAALRWEFRPALVNGHPVAVWVTAQFAFRLH